MKAGALGSAAAPGLALLRPHVRNVSGCLRRGHRGEERPQSMLAQGQLAVSRMTSGWLPTTNTLHASMPPY